MPGSKVYTIDEKTKVPMGLAWTVAGAMVSIAMAFATLLVKQDEVQARVSNLDGRVTFIDKDRVEKRDKFLETLTNIEIKLGKIEEKLHIQDDENE